MPGLTEIIDAAKGTGGTGRNYAAMKKKWTNDIALLAKATHMKPVERATFRFIWTEKDRSRNPDNIAAAHKFLLDGLVTCGVLANDGWKQIAGWTDEFVVGDKAGVMVEINS